MEIVTKFAPVALALIMLGLGLSLTTSDFIRVVKNPKIFFIGLFTQLVLLPTTAYIIILIFKTPAKLALGLMMIASAPGGVTSNVLTKFAKGDVALSISLTAITSLICIISVPFIVFNSANLIGISGISENLSMVSIASKMASVVTVPVIIGMIIRKIFSSYIIKNVKVFENITIFLFLLVFLAIWIEEGENIIKYLSVSGKIVLTLNILMMIIAYNIAKLFSSNLEQKKCIAIECGLQNGTLAVFVSSQLFDEIIFIIPTACYALTMYITAFIFIYFLKNAKS